MNEHSSSTIIGFAIDQDDLLMPFKVTKPEEFHMEDRFSPKTGAKLAKQEKVIDREEYEVYVVDGTEYECETEAVEALEAIFDCQISLHGNFCDGVNMMYGIESKTPVGDDAVENDGIPLSYIAKVEPDLRRIRGAFKERFGIELGTPGIYNLESYG